MNRPTLTLIAALGLAPVACGLLDTELATITYEEGIPFDFEVDATALCPADVDCDVETQPAHETVALDPIEFDIAVDIVEASGNPQLQGVAQRLRSIEITSIDYEIADNDLNFDLPSIDIYVGPLEAQSSEDEGVVLLTTIPIAEAGQDVSGRAEVSAESLEVTSELFKSMQFAAIPKSQPVIEEGEPFPPQGAAQVKLTINIKIVANPIDAIQ
ncbi:hypothetical protein DL240_05050 [Lujinxingia litoralis]|uniref:Uncharacterized protein n=1 Tax=Lujinxingia litoralis TaxID=2211119 RepID=A0A328CCC9_9DELT|nr:hypothetical protein [Lujinxingia litoralis]RAL23531.1 hypothetical protein DL240_05050 [Lujinxingia litoralis]